VLWLLTNSLLDGPVLFASGAGGMHVGDLLALPALGLVGVLCLRT
jgi:hypothetical protein